MVELLFIGMAIVVGIILLELSKHIVTRTTLKVVVLLVLGLIVFLTITGSLSNEDVIKSDNEFIKTGAAVAGSINEQPLTIKIKDKARSFISDFEDKYLD